MAGEPADVYRISQAYLAALRNREMAVVRRMIEAYGRIWRSMEEEVAALQRQIVEGQAVGDWQRWRLVRHQALMAQVQDELRQFGAVAEEEVQGLQAHALRAGLDLSAAQIRAIGGIGLAFDRLPVSALEHMVGFLSDGSPLRALLDGLGTETGRRIGNTLTEALAQGWNPKKTAREIRRESGMGLTRALRIARTEQMRAFRSATLAGYRQSRVVARYRRIAAKSRRTCIACLLKDGEVYELSEEFTDHVNGRCVIIPVLRGKEVNIGRESGREWFAKQPAETQRKILGNNALFDAWKRGEIDLDDMAHYHQDRRWGDSWQAASLKQARANAQARGIHVGRLQALANWAKKEFGIREVDYSGLALEVAEAINASLAQHFRLFPALKGRIDFVGSDVVLHGMIMERVQRMAEESVRKEMIGASEIEILAEIQRRLWPYKALLPGDQLAGSLVDVSPRGWRAVILNQWWGSRAEPLQAELQRLEQEGWHVSGSGSLKALIDHELGHFLESMLSLRADPFVVDLRRKAAEAGWVNALARIAEEHPGEFVPEAWTEFLNSVYPRELARALGEYILKRISEART